MVEISTASGKLDVHVLGWSRLWAFKRRISIPLSAIVSVRSAPPALWRGIWKGLRAPGTYIPGIIVAGTYYVRGERSFWDVRNLGNAIVLELNGSHPYGRLVVEVENPALAVKTIENAI